MGKKCNRLAQQKEDRDHKFRFTSNTGNFEFVKGDLHAAIDCYTYALSIRPSDANLLSNRGAALIRVRNFRKAIMDLKVVIQLENKTSSVPTLKTLHRLCKAKWGLKEYDNELFSILETAATWYYCKGSHSEYKEVWSLLTTSKRMQKESRTGEYDMVKLATKQEQVYNCGEYCGPIEIQLVAGKGRGIIATAPIKAGQVIMGCKAFAIVFSPLATNNSEKIEKSDNLTSGEGKDTESKPPDEEQTLRKKLSENFARLMFIISNMLKANPELCLDVGALNCGTGFFPFPVTGQGSANTMTGAGDTSNQRQYIDINLEHILCLNGTVSGSNPNPRRLPDPNEVDGLVSKNTYGLWILPSYLNHSCVDINAESQIFGDMMIVRALKNVEKGEEILVCYTNYGRIETESCALELKEFREICNFICHCRFCRMVAAEPDWLQNRITQLHSAGLTATKDNDLEDIEMQLEALLPNYPDLNFSIFGICRKIASLHKTPAIGMYKKAACYFEKAYNLTEFSGHFRHRIPLAIEICSCYIKVGDEVEAMKWAEKLKMDFLITYGVVKDVERLLPIVVRNYKMEVDAGVMANLIYFCFNASKNDMFQEVNDDIIDREIPILIEGVRRGMVNFPRIKTEKLN